MIHLINVKFVWNISSRAPITTWCHRRRALASSRSIHHFAHYLDKTNMKLLPLLSITATTAFTTPSHLLSTPQSHTQKIRASFLDDDTSSSSIQRRSLLTMMAYSSFFNLFGGNNGNSVANAAGVINAGKGPTNEVIKTVNGMKLRRLGGSDILVSELGLGTQRW